MDAKKKQNAFPLRLPKTTRLQADNLAEREGISLNEFIRLAVAEKIVRLEQLPWLNEIPFEDGSKAVSNEQDPQQ